MDVQWYVTVVLNCNSLMTYVIKHFFNMFVPHFFLMGLREIFLTQGRNIQLAIMVEIFFLD